MDKNIEQLLITAGKMMDEAGGGDDWQAVVKASDVPPAVAERLVSQGLLRRHLEIAIQEANGGLEQWHFTATAKGMVSEMIVAESEHPRKFGGKGWSRKSKR